MHCATALFGQLGTADENKRASYPRRYKHLFGVEENWWLQSGSVSGLWVAIIMYMYVYVLLVYNSIPVLQYIIWNKKWSNAYDWMYYLMQTTKWHLSISIALQFVISSHDMMIAKIFARFQALRVMPVIMSAHAFEETGTSSCVQQSMWMWIIQNRNACH